MTAWLAAGRGGFVAAVVARAEGWLLEPAAPRPRAADPEPGTRSVVAVVGLGPRSGTTTIARALAIELARRDGGGAAIVAGGGGRPTGAGVPSVATAPARRLARALPPEAARAVGRLCLIEGCDPAVRELSLSRPVPLVLDVGHGDPPESAVAMADATLLVAAPGVEPALAEVVAASLTRDGDRPLVVVNRALDADAWVARDALLVGEARLGARLALAGRDPAPGLARPVADLADRLVGEESL